MSVLNKLACQSNACLVNQYGFKQCIINTNVLSQATHLKAGLRHAWCNKEGDKENSERLPIGSRGYDDAILAWLDPDTAEQTYTVTSGFFAMSNKTNKELPFSLVKWKPVQFWEVAHWEPRLWWCNVTLNDTSLQKHVFVAFVSSFTCSQVC
jgi:hypothetical protein